MSPNPIQRAVAGLAHTLNTLTAYLGDYSRSEGPTLRIRGTLVFRDYEVTDDDGVVTVVKSSDWLFRTADLDQLSPPLPGDQWELLGSNYGSPEFEEGAIFEAMNIGKQPCYEPHDAHGVMLVVHMRKVPHA